MKSNIKEKLLEFLDQNEYFKKDCTVNSINESDNHYSVFYYDSFVSGSFTKRICFSEFQEFLISKCEKVESKAKKLKENLING